MKERRKEEERTKELPGNIKKKKKKQGLKARGVIA